MERLIDIDDKEMAMLEEASYHLIHHGVVAFPTDSVMGLGVVYDDEFAYTRLNNIKNRPESKPYALMVAFPNQISLFAHVDERAKKVIDAFLPGPLTVLLKAKPSVPGYVTHNTGIIGIRVTSHNLTRWLLTFTGKPLLAPSANRSGEPPATNSDQVREVFGKELDYIVEGSAEIGSATTVVDLTKDEPIIVREGPVSLQQILDVINKE